MNKLNVVHNDEVQRKPIIVWNYWARASTTSVRLSLTSLRNTKTTAAIFALRTNTVIEHPRLLLVGLSSRGSNDLVPQNWELKPICFQLFANLMIYFFSCPDWKFFLWPHRNHNLQTVLDCFAVVNNTYFRSFWRKQVCLSLHQRSMNIQRGWETSGDDYYCLTIGMNVRLLWKKSKCCIHKPSKTIRSICFPCQTIIHGLLEKFHHPDKLIPINLIWIHGCA